MLPVITTPIKTIGQKSNWQYQKVTALYVVKSNTLWVKLQITLGSLCLKLSSPMCRSLCLGARPLKMLTAAWIVSSYFFILSKSSSIGIFLSVSTSLRFKISHWSICPWVYLSNFPFVYPLIHPCTSLQPPVPVSLTSFSSKVECLLCSVGPLEGWIICLRHTTCQSHRTSLSHCLIWSHWLERIFIIIYGITKDQRIVSSTYHQH